jgi:hypothetical protein
MISCSDSREMTHMGTARRYRVSVFFTDRADEVEEFRLPWEALDLRLRRLLSEGGAAASGTGSTGTSISARWTGKASGFITRLKC